MRNSSIALAILALVASQCRATPIVKIAGALQWQQAINNGSIQGVQPGGAGAVNASNTQALNKIFPGQAGALANAQVAGNAAPVNGLASQIGTTANQNTSTIGAVAYIGPDPDWTGFYAHLNPYFPQVGAAGTAGFDMFSFAIIDTSDNVKAWTWDSSVLATGFNNFVVHVSDGAGAGGSTGFYQDAGFDISHGAYLQFGYRGTPRDTTPGIDPFPDGTLVGGMGDLNVSPESDSLILFAGGLIGMGLFGGRWSRCGRRNRRSCSSSC